MVKKIIRFVIIFWGIFSLLRYSYSIYYVYFANMDSGEIFITTWLDSNADGIQNPNEEPLPNVCIWHLYSPKADIPKNENKCDDEFGEEITNESGNYQIGIPTWWECNDYFTFAKPPNGFQPTTTSIAKGCTVIFGFAPENVKLNSKTQSVEEFIQLQKTIYWSKKVVLYMVVFVFCALGTIWLQKNS